MQLIVCVVFILALLEEMFLPNNCESSSDEFSFYIRLRVLQIFSIFTKFDSVLVQIKI